jgi:hypothetical protein
MSGSYCATQTDSGCTSPQACTSVTVKTTPVITGSSKTNPTTCGGSNGTITLNGLSKDSSYSVTYNFNGNPQGPVVLVGNASGQVVISGLSAGSYTNFVVTLTGCPSAPLGGTITLSNPSTPPAPTLGNNGPVCSGTTLTLSATGVGTSFSWTGPNSFTSSAQSPTVSTHATVGMSGQ